MMEVHSDTDCAVVDAKVARLEAANAAKDAALREHGGFHAPKDCGDKHRPHGNAKPGTSCFYCEPALSPDAGEGWLSPEVREQARVSISYLAALSHTEHAQPFKECEAYSCREARAALDALRVK